MFDPSKTCSDYGIENCAACSQGVNRYRRCYVEWYATTIDNPKQDWAGYYSSGVGCPKDKVREWCGSHRAYMTWLRKAVELTHPELLGYLDAFVLLK